MDQYTLKIHYQAKDDQPIQTLQRHIIKNDIARTLQDHHPYLVFDIEEVKE